jgi:DNA adenine methylase
VSSPEVRPLRGIAPYVGGKRHLAASLVEIIDRTPHVTYVEPFVGMGGVFFRRHNRPKVEVVNDLSMDVATLFRVLQRQYLPFVEMLRWQITTRSEFERLVATNPDTLTDLERAARFFYLQKTAFGAKVVGRNFGVSPGERGAFDVTRIIPELEAYHERLAGVVVEHLPYAECVARYDRPGTLFFLDPPYLGSEHYYGRGLFGRADFEVLKDLLRGLKGRFLMTVNDCPETRRIFAQFPLRSRSLSYSVHGQGRPKRVRELIISSKG